MSCLRNWRNSATYVLPLDGGISFPDYAPTSQADYEDKLDTAAKLMQIFTAEEMNLRWEDGDAEPEGN